jgi:hypothetical protein
LTKKIDNSRKVFPRGGDAGNKRYSWLDDGRSSPKKPTEVIKYFAVRLAGVFLVNSRVGNFDVKIHQVNVRKNPLLKNVVAEVPACFQGKVNLPGLKAFHERLEVVGIQGTFAAGKSDSTIRVAIK